MTIPIATQAATPQVVVDRHIGATGATARATKVEAAEAADAAAAEAVVHA